MKHLTLVFGAPPHVLPPQAQSPFFPQPPARPTPQAPANAPAGTRPPSAPASTPTAVGSSAKPAGAAGQIDPEDFHTPAASPLPGAAAAAVEELLAECTTSPKLPYVPGFPSAAVHPNAVASASSGGTGADAVAPVTSSVAVGSKPAPTFTLTLRRAEQVPLGLEVKGDHGASCLIVEQVMPGGAVEAWNRQCAGDTREIKTGDRIIRINGAEDADSMRMECLSKHLLKMTVLRGSVDSGPGATTATSAGTPTISQGFGLGGLRADADEFVPQEGPWPTLGPAVDVLSC